MLRLVDGPETFGDRFKRLTEGLNPREMAYVMDVDEAIIRKIKTGDVKSIKLEEAMRMCAHFGIDPFELAGVDAKQPVASGEAARLSRQDLSDLQETIREMQAAIGELQKGSPVPAAAKKAGQRLAG